MNLNFCRVVLLGVVSHYFLQDFIRIIAISPSWEKKRFPEVHTFLFKTDWTFSNNAVISRSRNLFFFFFSCCSACGHLSYSRNIKKYTRSPCPPALPLLHHSSDQTLSAFWASPSRNTKHNHCCQFNSDLKNNNNFFNAVRIWDNATVWSLVSLAMKHVKQLSSAFPFYGWNSHWFTQLPRWQNLTNVCPLSNNSL